MSIVVRDVTLREFGQNVRPTELRVFSTDRRLWLARELIDLGFQSIEVASTASATVAPAMDPALLEPFLRGLGRSKTTELITLVPSEGGYHRFNDLGLGPEGLNHTMGVFISAMDEHNLSNLGCTVDDSLASLSSFIPKAISAGTRVVGYVSAAFGFSESLDTPMIRPSGRRVSELIEGLAELGAQSVTLSDLQGLASESETYELLDEVINGPLPSPVPVGYHPHHTSIEAALRNVEAAVKSGVELFDGSLGAVGGCVTGAPGNAPTDGIVETLEGLGISTVLDPKKLRALALRADKLIYRPLHKRMSGNRGKESP